MVTRHRLSSTSTSRAGKAVYCKYVRDVHVWLASTSSCKGLRIEGIFVELSPHDWGKKGARSLAQSQFVSVVPLTFFCSIATTSSVDFAACPVLALLPFFLVERGYCNCRLNLHSCTTKLTSLCAIIHHINTIRNGLR